MQVDPPALDTETIDEDLQPQHVKKEAEEVETRPFHALNYVSGLQTLTFAESLKHGLKR